MNSIFKDGIAMLTDSLNYRESKDITYGKSSPFTLKTSIDMGYDLYVDENGISRLGEPLFTKRHNLIVLGGSLFVLEKLFGVKPNSLTVDYLNTFMNIGTSGPAITTQSNLSNRINLFNVGIGGCGAAYDDVLTAKQQMRVVPNMIPFRLTDVPLTGEQKAKYWFCQQQPNGKYAYYLKKFDSNPTVKVLWKDAQKEDDDGTPVTSGVHDSSRNEQIQSFVECLLSIDKTDLREYFEVYGGIEKARFNSMGLCSGVLGSLADGTEEYKNVSQISVLNFGNELLHMNKTLSIIYRIYI